MLTPCMRVLTLLGVGSVAGRARRHDRRSIDTVGCLRVAGLRLRVAGLRVAELPPLCWRVPSLRVAGLRLEPLVRLRLEPR